MGCCGGDREKGAVSAEQKWDYITLDDFKARGCLTPFSYTWLIFLTLIALGVFAADIFTAVQLLAFNRWSSEVQPAVPFNISKWIFAIAIILSVVLYGYEFIRAYRVVKRNSIAECYLDPTAAIWQSLRPGSGKGWRRFLVFAELTRSRKGVDYTAIFVYFQFKSAIRIIVAEGPRVVVNAITLYSVLRLNLLPDGRNAPKDGKSGLQQFWQNVEVLANKDQKQAIILSSMLFTLVVWVFSAIFLLTSIILYLLFLWHIVPSADGSLTRYCRRKIDSRLDGIVSKKTRKALEKQEKKRRREQAKARKKGEGYAKATLPELDDDNDSIFSRTDTMSTKTGFTRTETLSTNASKPTLPTIATLSRQPTLPEVSGRPTPSRSATGSSYASNAGLLSNSGGMGYDDEPTPTLPTPTPMSASSPRDYFNSSPSDYRPGPPGRSFTGSTQRSYGSPLGPNGSPIIRPPTAQSRGGPTPGPGQLRRLDTADTMNSSYSRRTPGLGQGNVTPISPFNDPRSGRNSPQNRFDAGPSYEMTPVGNSPPGGSPLNDYDNRPPTRSGATTAPGFPGLGSRPSPRPMPARSGTAQTAPPASGGYVAFNPNMGYSAPPSSGTPTPTPQANPYGLPPPLRNFSSPGPVQRANTAQGFGEPQRSFTSPSMPRLQEDPTVRSATGPPQGGYGGYGAF